MTEHSDYRSPKDDTRLTQELFSVAVTEDEDTSWKAIMALHFRGTRDVLEKSEELCRSAASRDRETAAAILGQLGIPDRTFPEESFQALARMLHFETDPGVLQSIATAFGHLNDPRAIRLLAPFVNHSSSDVRYGVVHGMSRHEDELAIRSLIQLSSDEDSEIRDWATFGLGQMIPTDTPEIRNALLARTSDSHQDTRCEALVGLARRKDTRVFEPLLGELTGDTVGLLALEAAEELADPRLAPALMALRDAWKGDTDKHVGRLHHALLSCLHPTSVSPH